MTLREKLGNKSITELMKCGDRPACAQDKLGPLGATKAVIGKLSHDEKNYVLQLYFIDLVNMNVISDIDRSILIASRRFQKDVEAAIPGFLRGEREAKGTLVVNATVANAQVTLNGEFMGVAPLTTTLKPGKYEIRVEKKSYLPVKRFVDVEPNKKTVEEVRMLLVPGEKPEEEQVPSLPTAQAEQRGGGGFRPTAPTILFGIFTLLAAGTGFAFGAVTSGAQSDLVKGYNPTTNTYAGTRVQALTARTDAYVANTAFIVAGVALVATIVFAILDGLRPPEGEAQVEVAPPSPAGGTP
jgi:hypothetical protein